VVKLGIPILELVHPNLYLQLVIKDKLDEELIPLVGHLMEHLVLDPGDAGGDGQTVLYCIQEGHEGLMQSGACSNLLAHLRLKLLGEAGGNLLECILLQTPRHKGCIALGLTRARSHSHKAGGRHILRLCEACLLPPAPCPLPPASCPCV